MPEFPVTTTDLDKYNLLVKQKVEKKYTNLIRNVYFYLTYICLELQDFHNCIKYGQLLDDMYTASKTVT